LLLVSEQNFSDNFAKTYHQLDDNAKQTDQQTYMNSESPHSTFKRPTTQHNEVSNKQLVAWLLLTDNFKFMSAFRSL